MSEKIFVKESVLFLFTLRHFPKRLAVKRRFSFKRKTKPMCVTNKTHAPVLPRGWVWRLRTPWARSARRVPAAHVGAVGTETVLGRATGLRKGPVLGGLHGRVHLRETVRALHLLRCEAGKPVASSALGPLRALSLETWTPESQGQNWRMRDGARPPFPALLPRGGCGLRTPVPLGRRGGGDRGAGEDTGQSAGLGLPSGRASSYHHPADSSAFGEAATRNVWTQRTGSPRGPQTDTSLYGSRGRRLRKARGDPAGWQNILEGSSGYTVISLLGRKHCTTQLN